MEGAPAPKKARVKVEYETHIVELEDAGSQVLEIENQRVQSVDIEDSNPIEQFDGIDVSNEYEEHFPLNFHGDIKQGAVPFKNSNTKFILCQPNETLETVKYSWTQSMTYILIEEYRKMMTDFQDPHKKQKDLWIKLAENMCLRGCDVTWDMCDQKWRNLKHTFKSIYLNRHRSEKSKRRWDFYQALEDVFAPQFNSENIQQKEPVTSPYIQDDDTDICSSKYDGNSKKPKTKVETVKYPFLTCERVPDIYSACDSEAKEVEKVATASVAGATAGQADESIPPLWFQEFLSIYRQQEEKRLALVKEMHSELLQIERRKCAALESLLVRLTQR